MTPCDRIYKTGAYDLIERYCDDEQGGDYENSIMADKFDNQAVVNLLIPLIRREIKEAKAWQ